MNKFPQCERSFSVYEIETLFAKGKHRVEGSIKMVVKRDPPIESKPRIKVLFSVPKRAFKRANKRNMLRRRMKESYRLNKSLVTEFVKEERLSIAWIYLGKEILSYQQIHESISKHIQWLIKNLQKNSSPVDSGPHQSV